MLSLLILGCLSSGLEGHFGKQYNWMSLHDGVEESRKQNKPVLAVIQKSWCSACQSLGKRFSRSPEVQSLADQFVFVSFLDDEEPLDKRFSPGIFLRLKFRFMVLSFQFL